MYKDHKAGKKTRPVVPGCNSNTRGMSNCVSDLQESVNKANKSPYEVISGEDMLAEVENYNTKAAEIIREGQGKLDKKINCTNKSHTEDGIRKIARCDKLWRIKSSKASGESPAKGEQTGHYLGRAEPGEETSSNEGGEEKEDAVTGNECVDEKDVEILRYRMHQYRENPVMKICGEDVQLVMECDHCGPDITEYMQEECDDCGGSWVREDYTMCVIGNDVISLFPSLDSVNTGRIVREEVENSTMRFDGFNIRLGLKYIAMNEEYTGNLEQIRSLLPVRETKPGTKPTMKSKWVNSKEILADDEWIYPPGNPTEEQRRQVIGRVAEIGTRVVFENFCYQFGGKAFHQQEGGPIGARVTMCAARMVMQHWAREYTGILLQAGLRLPLMTGYVDDGRQGSTVLRRGMRFNEERSV